MKEFEEAESWLAAAKALLDSRDRGRERFTVVAALCIHSMIKANDALTLRFLGRRSTRHEDASKLFGDLVRSNKVAPPHTKLRALLSEAVSEKSEYDYKGREVSRTSAVRWVRDAERFLAAVREILGR